MSTRFAQQEKSAMTGPKPFKVSKELHEGRTLVLLQIPGVGPTGQGTVQFRLPTDDALDLGRQLVDLAESLTCSWVTPD